MICCIKHWYHTMDLGLPFHSCTFDDITITSSSFRGNPIFLIIPCFWKHRTPPSNSNFTCSISMIISKKLLKLLKITAFVFQLSVFLWKKRALFINILNKNSLFLVKKTPVTWKQKQLSSKANVIFLDIIMLMLLAKFECDGWFHFFQKQGIIKK